MVVVEMALRSVNARGDCGMPVLGDCLRALSAN